MRFSKAWKILSVAALLGGTSFAQGLPGMEISGFRVPDYDANGNMISQFFGEKAVFEEGSEVKITNLRTEFYRDGETVMEVTSPLCFYDQKAKTARSDAPVAADAAGLTVRGNGYVLDSAARTVRVLRDCRVVISGLMGSNTTASAEASTNVTVITSKEMFLDYKDRSVLFEKDVCVEDPQLRLLSDTMKVGFSEKNEISWIVAEGAVRMFHEGREANAGKAVYDVATDEFLLEDNPKLIDGRNTLVGEKIRFRRASGQMVCEPSARLVVFPDKNLKTDLFEK